MAPSAPRPVKASTPAWDDDSTTVAPPPPVAQYPVPPAAPRPPVSTPSHNILSFLFCEQVYSRQRLRHHISLQLSQLAMIALGQW